MQSFLISNCPEMISLGGTEGRSTKRVRLIPRCHARWRSTPCAQIGVSGEALVTATVLVFGLFFSTTATAQNSQTENATNVSDTPGSSDAKGAEVQASSFEPSKSTDASATCVPACRTGFVCVGGNCVSRCNPPCASYERCTEGGECEWRAPPAGPPVALTQQHDDKVVLSDNNYSKSMYEKFERKRIGGIVANSIGAALLLGSAVCYIIAGVNYADVNMYEYDEKKETIRNPVIVGAALDVGATVAFITGIVLVVKGRRGMKKAKRGEFERSHLEFGHSSDTF